MRALLEKIPADEGRFFLVKRRLDARFEFCWHHHRELELTLIVRSCGRRFVGDSIADYADGDLVLLGPNLPHSWCSVPPRPAVKHEAVVVQFGEDFLGPGRLNGLKLGRVRDLFDRANRGIRFYGEARWTVAERLQQLERRPPLLQLAELLVILDLLSRASEYDLLSSRTFAPELRSETPHPIDRVWRLIDERFLGRIPLAEAARVLGMSPSAFSRFFHRSTGKTFTGYLNELRIGHACRLLMDTERGVADIAGSSGFTNLSHFNRCFLKVKKMRPSDFRREYRRHGALAPTGSLRARS
jgi:AraC-like DNA-binding protein